MEDVVKSEKKAKIANKTTEIILGKAAQRIETGIKSLLQVAPEIEKLQENIKNGTLEVVNLEDKIGNLKQELSNKIAQNKIDLEQAYNRDQKSYVDGWLKENNMTVIATGELDDLRDNLKQAEQNTQKAVTSAVNAATNALTEKYNNTTAILKLEHEKKEADNTATIKQQQQQIKFLEEQVNHWKTMLETQQKNETERAKYAQINTLNVGDPNARR